MHISEYPHKTFLEELIIFLKCRETLFKIFCSCNVGKNAAVPQLFILRHILRTIPKNFWSFYKFFQSVQQNAL